MPVHRLFIEANDWTNNAWHGSNHVPMVAWDMREGTDWDIPRVPNADAIRRLADLPRELRGVMIPWFADYRLSAEHVRRSCTDLAAALAEIGGCDLIFTDNEEQPFDAGTLGRLKHFAGMLTPHADAVCNWNSCLAGKGWWGPYDGHVIGTHSCPQSYEMTTTPDVSRWMATVRACLPDLVVHLPPCERRSEGRVDGEYGTNNVYARARQLCMYAASRGVRRYIYAEYMVPERSACVHMLRTISRCLTDCDVLYRDGAT